MMNYGPWHGLPVPPGKSFPVVNDERRVVAFVNDRRDVPVIAEAPAMRQVLQDLKQWAAYMGGFDSHVWLDVDAVLARIKNAERERSEHKPQGGARGEHEEGV